MGRNERGILLPAIAVALLVGAGGGAVVALSLRREPIPALEETRFMNFDAETTTAEALASGWSGFERNPQNDTYVWCASSACVLAVQAHKPSDRAIRMRTWAFRFPDAPKQKVTVFVNDKEVAMHVLGETTETWGFFVPADHWKEGQNLVRFECTYAARPSDHGAGDSRTLSVAFDWIDIVPE